MSFCPVGLGWTSRPERCRVGNRWAIGFAETAIVSAWTASMRAIPALRESRWQRNHLPRLRRSSVGLPPVWIPASRRPEVPSGCPPKRTDSIHPESTSPVWTSPVWTSPAGSLSACPYLGKSACWAETFHRRSKRWLRGWPWMRAASDTSTLALNRPTFRQMARRDDQTYSIPVCRFDIPPKASV